MRSILNLILIVYIGISGSLQARNPVLLPLPQKDNPLKKYKPTGQPIQDRGFLG